MKHIIIGGDGFVGHQLALDLTAAGERVVVADIVNSGHALYRAVPFIRVDVTAPETLRAIPLEAGDAVYNLAAKMLSPLQVRAKRREFFWPVNHGGPSNILAWMEEAGARRFVQFTTDMVFGHVIPGVRQDEDHPMAPLGEYGASKKAAEEACQAYRGRGFDITIFRPRLIIGPGRLGILAKLFRLIDANLPVPMIGRGQPVPVHLGLRLRKRRRRGLAGGLPQPVLQPRLRRPAARARPARRADPARGLEIDPRADAGLRGEAHARPVRRAEPADHGPEQFLIADEFCIRETGRAKAELGWAPRHRDSDMLNAAYAEYRKALAAGGVGSSTTVYQRGH